jgi:hypothetical protein
MGKEKELVVWRSFALLRSDSGTISHLDTTKHGVVCVLEGCIGTSSLVMIYINSVSSLTQIKLKSMDQFESIIDSSSFAKRKLVKLYQLTRT